MMKSPASLNNSGKCVAGAPKKPLHRGRLAFEDLTQQVVGKHGLRVDDIVDEALLIAPQRERA